MSVHAIFMGWAPPTTTSPPPPVTDAAATRQFEMMAKPRPKGAGYLAGAAVVHALSIPIGLVLFKALVESAAGRSVSWGELADALNETGYMGIILGGIFGQVIFAAVAGLGAFILHNGRTGVAIPMVVVGAIAAFFSFIVFGGIFGALGGLLSIAGGWMGRSRPAAPYPVYAYPPPYAGPPPRPPP